MLRTTNRRRGFTLVELLVVISIIALLIGILLPAIGKARRNALKLKDATQLRGIMQSMQQYAADNRDRYPDPEREDPGDVAIGELDSGSKNTTGNILSILIWNRTISPEICVSPAENGEIQVYENYSYDTEELFEDNLVNEGSGLIPFNPTFKGSPVDQFGNNLGSEVNYEGAGWGAAIGHNSYAHNAFGFSRRSLWTSTLSSSRPVWSNRGPVYTQDDSSMFGAGETWTLLGAQVAGGSGGGSDSDRVFGAESATLLWFGRENSWAGNVAYADASVSFSDVPDSDRSTFTEIPQGGTTNLPITRSDNLFVDEVNEGNGDARETNRNAIMRVWALGIPTSTADQDAETWIDYTSDSVYVDGDSTTG